MEAIVMQALGEEGFASLVAAFYRRVRTDALIGAMYPDDDWEGSEKRLRDFLIFRFGGSDRYLIQRGHPRLRMRHMPFRIGEAERDRWLELMDAAMDEVSLEGDARSYLAAFFAMVADSMRNQPDNISSE
jgi:hemoglobin